MLLAYILWYNSSMNGSVKSMKIIAFTGAGIIKTVKHSNIYGKTLDVREKLFRSYAEKHHEEYNEVIRQLKANMNGSKA